MRKIVVFDMDGTLVETDAANGAAYETAVNRIGIGSAICFCGRVTASVISEALGSAIGVGIDDVERVKMEEYSRQLWRAKLGGAADAFKCVILNRDMFNKVVLLSDGKERRVLETLRHFRLGGFFDEIVCNGGRGDKYANYFRLFDSDPAACLVWENDERQIASAITAGVRVENIRKVG